MVRMCLNPKLRLLMITGELSEFTPDEKQRLIMPVFKNPNQSQPSENNADSEGKYQKRLKQVLNKSLKDHQMNPLSDITLCRVTMQGSCHVVNNARIFHIPDKKNNIYLVWGELLNSGNSRHGIDESINSPVDISEEVPSLTEIDFLKKVNETEDEAEVEAKVSASAETVIHESFHIPDGSTFTPNDVQLVCDNTGCSESEAIQGLIANKSDLVSTIMALTPI